VELSPCREAARRLATKFPNVLWKLNFLAMFAIALHWFLSWIRWIQSVPPHPVSLTCILLSTSHLRLGLSTDSFLLVMYGQKILILFRCNFML
jgi:hypothetical protein